MAWVHSQPPGGLFTTAITLAEGRYGIARLPDGHRKDELGRAADEVFATFPDQTMPFDSAAASVYAHLVASRERAGEPIPGFDAQIAAVCRVHGAPLATRNARDFRNCGLKLINRWDGRGGR